mmetsp:Transcript_4961/g.6413  ORF Transcript_4961/g.6413 Transcript_4961/m.6413 type:complete len:435 (+) Transcript_4961:84-1388(+)
MDEEDIFEICGLSTEDFSGIIEDEDIFLPAEPTQSERTHLKIKQPLVSKVKQKIEKNDADICPQLKEEEEVLDHRKYKEQKEEIKNDNNELELNLNVVKAVEKNEISKEEATKFSLLQKDINWSKENARFCCESDLEGLDAFCIDGLLTEDECDTLINTAELSNKFSFWSNDNENKNLRDFRNADTIEMTHSSIANEIWIRIKSFLNSSITLNINENETPERYECDIEGTWDACGTNENLLISRYSPGGHFAPHTDGYSVIDINHRSMYTLLIYLNDCNTPGAGDGGTRFYRDEAKGNLIHEGHTHNDNKDHDDSNKAENSNNNGDDGKARYTSDRKYEICCIPAIKGRCLVFYHNHIHEGTPPTVGNQKYIIRSDVMYTRRNPICTLPKDIEAYNLYRKAVDIAGVQGREKEALPLFQKAFKMSQNLADVYGM